MRNIATVGLFLLVALTAGAAAAGVDADSAQRNDASTSAIQTTPVGEANPLDAEMSALGKEIAALAFQWDQDVIASLARSSSANDLALASLAMSRADLFQVIRCEKQSSCDQAATFPGATTLSAEALLTRLLNKSAQIDFNLLVLVTERFWQQLDTAQRGSLVEQLLSRGPDDWRSWALKLKLLAELGADEESKTALLVQAAIQSTGSREWYFSFMRRFHASFESVPAPLGLAQLLPHSDPAELDARTVDQMRWTLAMGRAMAIAVPSIQLLAQSCRDQQSLSPERLAACIVLARTLVESTATYVEIGAGINIWHRLTEGSADEAAAVAAKRKYYWEQERGAQVRAEAMRQPDWMDDFIDEMRQPDSSERSAILDAMKAAGMPEQPPDWWRPMNPEVMDARR